MLRKSHAQVYAVKDIAKVIDGQIFMPKHTHRYLFEAARPFVKRLRGQSLLMSTKWMKSIVSVKSGEAALRSTKGELLHPTSFHPRFS